MRGLAAHSLEGPVGIEIAFEGLARPGRKLGDSVEMESVDALGLEGTPRLLDQTVRLGAIGLRETVLDASLPDRGLHRGEDPLTLALSPTLGRGDIIPRISDSGY